MTTSVDRPPGQGRRAVTPEPDALEASIAITNRMLAAALEELETAGVAQEAVTVVPVPGAFELPLAAMALADGKVSLEEWTMLYAAGLRHGLVRADVNLLVQSTKQRLYQEARAHIRQASAARRRTAKG